MKKLGYPLLLPEYILEGWTTTLPQRFDIQAIIALCTQHATHEQFHSQFKSDMDLAPLALGKFDTTFLVCQLACVALNLLLLIGQHTLHGPDAPLRYEAKRWHIRTVIQEMMFKAARLIRHAGRWVLGIGGYDTRFAVFERRHGRLGAA